MSTRDYDGGPGPFRMETRSGGSSPFVDEWTRQDPDAIREDEDTYCPHCGGGEMAEEAEELAFEMRDELDEHEVEDFDRFAPFELQVPPPTIKATIGFEFDTNIGLDSTVFAARASAMTAGATQPGEGDPVTDHVGKTGAGVLADGFDTKIDGPRMEIATIPIAIDDDATFKKVGENIVKFAKELETARAKKKPDTSITVHDSNGREIKGHPIWFEHPRTKVAKLPLVIAARGGGSSQKWPTDELVWGAPQATITVRLEHVGELVDAIQATAGKGRGLALTGGKDDRMGLRSDVVVRAKKRVLADRATRIGTTLSDGSTLTATDFSDRLSGLLILMTQYMLAGEICCDPRDYEGFAKAYLPLNVKAPFRNIFKHAVMLTDRDRFVFKDIYHAHPQHFYGLARDEADAGDGDTRLFLPKTHWDLRRFHTTLPTWEMLLNFTVADTALKVTKANSVPKKHHALGDEILWAPLSSIIPISATEPRVALELRRIGYAAHFKKSWQQLMSTVRALTKKLNP